MDIGNFLRSLHCAWKMPSLHPSMQPLQAFLNWQIRVAVPVSLQTPLDVRLLWQCRDIATLFSVESVVDLLWRKILCQRCMHSSFPLRAGSHRCKVCSLFCVRVMDQGQLALDGGAFEQDFVQMLASHIMQLYAVVRSKGANSWIKVRSPLLVLNAIAVHG